MNMDAGSIIAWIIVGLVAGFLASLVVGGNLNLLGFLVAGLVGSVVGGWIADRAGLRLNLGSPMVDQIVIAFIGAVIVLLIVRLIF